MYLLERRGRITFLEMVFKLLHGKLYILHVFAFSLRRVIFHMFYDNLSYRAMYMYFNVHIIFPSVVDADLI